MNDIEDTLEYLTRKELQLNIMRNIEREIKNMGCKARLRWWWDHTCNWGKVQRFLNGNTQKAGSTSSTKQCIFIGVNPDGKSFYDMIEDTK